MNFTVSWLKRKKASLCILAGICAFSLFVIINSGEKIKENTGGSYVVKIKHYGLDAAEIERSITIPLEDSLSAIPGVMGVQSSSENSLSRVFIRFKPGGKGRYEAVRDAAQRVYEGLPSSAQRPEILSSNNSMIPVWSAAVFAGNSGQVNANDSRFSSVSSSSGVLEKTVKPRLESLEGAGEVIVSGTGLKEIVITLDQEKLAALGVEPQIIANNLGMNDAIFSGGAIVRQNREIIVTVDGRYGLPNTASVDASSTDASSSNAVSSPGASSLERALISLEGGKFIELSEIALITEQERAPDILSRLNGRKATVISIMGRHGADLRKLSKEIKKELSALSKADTFSAANFPAQDNLEFTILSDRGAEEAAAFRSVFNAALLGAIMVAFISFLPGSMSGGKNAANLFTGAGFFCALAIPLVCLVSVSALSIRGIPADRLMFAGIAAGVGTAVDSVILCSEKLRKCGSYGAAAAALSQLAGPLIAGAATTVAALLPLSLFEGGEATVLAKAVMSVTITSFIVSLVFLPPLLLWRLKPRDIHITRPAELTQPSELKQPALFSHMLSRAFRVLNRFLAADIKFCLRYPAVILITALALTGAAILALFVKGADTSNYGSQNSVYAQIEFDGGLLAEEADRLLASYGEKLAGHNGIKNVETGARTGSGSLLVSFDPKQTQAHIVREIAKQIEIPGGFLFFQENSAKDRRWEIIISGDEDKKCRELAQELAYLCAGHPLIRERVLNFKDGSKKLILQPDRERLTEVGISFSAAANKLRLGVYGPVAYKRTDASGETDVRIRTTGGKEPINDVMRQSREGLLGVLVSSADGGGNRGNFALRIDSLFNSKEEIEPSSIRRTDRRRSASITVITGPKDPRRVKQELDGVFKKLNLPPGYSIEFDPGAIRQAQSLTSTLISLILAVVFCYMIIASINESFTVPLLVLSAIPPSLAIPALFLALSGSAYTSSAACAFIAVSGMTVNASVLCVDSLRSSLKSAACLSFEHGCLSLKVYMALRRKIPALLATTSTTAAGAIPFLFLSEEANTLIRTLSLVGAIGVTSSFFCSITVIPSLLFLFKNSLKHGLSDIR